MSFLFRRQIQKLYERAAFRARRFFAPTPPNLENYFSLGENTPLNPSRSSSLNETSFTNNPNYDPNPSTSNDPNTFDDIDLA
jgi:hypothetical protein